MTDTTCPLCPSKLRDPEHLVLHLKEHHDIPYNEGAALSNERIDHPLHYGGDVVYEHIKVVQAWGLDYELGNCTKYICRAGKKNPRARLEDLRKAAWYLGEEIKKVEREEALRSED